MSRAQSLYRRLPLLAAIFIGATHLSAQPPFALTDSAPNAEAFQKRFLASYGVNSAIEPSFRPEDRILYEAVLPFLREDPEQAIREIERALRSADNPAFRYLLGNLHYELGAFDRAKAELNRAIEAFPDFRRAHRTLGLIHIQEGRYALAIETWLKVITLGGSDAQSYGLLAYAYLTEKKYQSALSAYRMARMFKPDSVDFRRGEAQCLLELQEHRQALALLNELIVEYPTSPEYWLLQANIHLQTEQYADAIINLEILHEMKAGTPDTHFMLGDLHLRDDNHQLAFIPYKAALAHPDFQERHHPRAIQALRHLANSQRFNEARILLTALPSTLPDALDNSQREALALVDAHLAIESGNTQQAFERLKWLVETNPLQAEALILIAELYQHSSDYEQAVFYLERALSIPDRKADALVALGRLEANRGRWKIALNHLRAAQQLQPSDSLRHYIRSLESILRHRPGPPPP